MSCAPAARQGPPSDWLPLAEAMDQEAIAVSRAAADWHMPLALASAYLQTSDPAGGCPLADSVVPAAACVHAPPDRGQDPEAPLAWGAALLADPLPWFGRLRCPGGATPTVARQAEPSGRQEWTVSCPDRPTQQWHVVARGPSGACGSPCPPGGLALLPAEALAVERLAEEALADARHGDALQHAIRLSQLAPGVASSWSQLGAAQAANNNYRAARDAFERAAQIDASSLDYAWYAALASWSARDWPDAAARATALLARLPPNDERRPEALCAAAIAQQHLGAPDAEALLATACAEGATGCCP